MAAAGRQCQYQLAIETSTAPGSIALGRGETVLETASVHQPTRHDVALVPAIASLCQRHGVQPGLIDQIYLSHGPGSFTGLRVAVACVKMLALSRGTRVVAVPTLDVVAANAPHAVRRVAVVLNWKHQSAYTRLYEREGDEIVPRGEPAVRELKPWLEGLKRPVAVLAPSLPARLEPAGGWAGIERLAEELARPRAEWVYRLGRRRAGEGGFADADMLTPLYAREPEAVTLARDRARRAEAMGSASPPADGPGDNGL